MASLSIPDTLPDTPMFEDMILEDVTADDWPAYDPEPWRFDGCKLDRCDITGQPLARLTMWDSIAVRVDLSATQLFKATLLRNEFIGCRVSGAQLGEATIKDVTFQQCKLNLLSFRSCTLERVVFEGCVLDEADFASARLKSVSFINCSMDKTTFDKAQCSNVDLTRSDISRIQGVMALKGTRIRPEQMLQLAPMLCSELGIVVAD